MHMQPVEKWDSIVDRPVRCLGRGGAGETSPSPRMPPFAFLTRKFRLFKLVESTSTIDDLCRWPEILNRGLVALCHCHETEVLHPLLRRWVAETRSISPNFLKSS